MTLHKLCRWWTRRTCLASLVMTVKNKNVLFTINKSDVHEPVHSDTYVVFSKASPKRRLPSSSQSIVTCLPVRTVMTGRR